MSLIRTRDSVTAVGNLISLDREEIAEIQDVLIEDFQEKVEWMMDKYDVDVDEARSILKKVFKSFISFETPAYEK